MVIDGLLARGATKSDESGYRYKIATRAGMLECNPHGDWVACVFREPDDPQNERAQKLRLIGPGSGKWNHHYSTGADRSNVDHFFRQLDHILLSTGPMVELPPPKPLPSAAEIFRSYMASVTDYASLTPAQAKVLAPIVKAITQRKLSRDQLIERNRSGKLDPGFDDLRPLRPGEAGTSVMSPLGLALANLYNNFDVLTGTSWRYGRSRRLDSPKFRRGRR